MSLEDALAKARDALDSGYVKNETSVRESVIAPILRELGWDNSEPRQWRAEYRVDDGLVDIALCDQLDKPVVFVEVKRPGNVSAKAEAQLFRYADNNGVPLLLLTDGDAWELYLSRANVEPSERRFWHHRFSENVDISGMAENLVRYLSRIEVFEGRAEASAKQRLTSILKDEQGRKVLPEAWQQLLAEPDESTNPSGTG